MQRIGLTPENAYNRPGTLPMSLRVLIATRWARYRTVGSAHRETRRPARHPRSDAVTCQVAGCVSAAF